MMQLSKSQLNQLQGTNPKSQIPNPKSKSDRAIVFIDAAVDELQSLVNGVIPEIEVILLEPTQDGVQQITKALRESPAVSTIHIVSHGSPGCLYLGNTQLSLDTLDDYAQDLQALSLQQCLLYGCNIAATEVGAAFLERLHQLTGANIAASTQRTGNSALGGNWELEYKIGTIDAVLAFWPVVMQAYQSVLPTVIYNGALDTLPQAQGFLSFGDLLPRTAVQTIVPGTGVNLNTAPQNNNGRRYAGYSSYGITGRLTNSNFPTIDATTGFTVSFTVAINSENSVSQNRAGFSLIVITDDLQGIEIGFNNNLIFAQQDNPLFTRGESIAYATNTPTNYQLNVEGNTYTLSANDTQILTGSLRNYTAFNAATSQPPLPFSPYTKPNLIFLGDNTDQADANITLSSLEVNRTPNNPVEEAYNATADKTLEVSVDTGVLANDTDPDNDALNSVLVTAPDNGTLILNPDGSFSYTPNTGFTGTDSFTYLIDDGSLTNPQSAIASIEVTPAPVIDKPLSLTKNANNFFVIDGSPKQTQLLLTLEASSKSPFVNEIGVFVVDDDLGTINGIAPNQPGYLNAALSKSQVVFSSLSNIPNGFSTANQTRILTENPSDRLVFYLVQNSTTDTALINLAGGQAPPNIFFASPSFNSDGFNHLQVTDQGNGVFTLRWEDQVGGGDQNFSDLVMNIQPTSVPLGLGTNLQGLQQRELLDLRTQTGLLQAECIVNREAAFDNFSGFCKVVDINGGIDVDGNGTADFLPGQTGYTQAAIQQRVPSASLTVANQATATFTTQLEGGSIYMPFIIVNGRPDALLDGNSSNDPVVYFPFLGANSDGVDHIRLLGNNTFGFEDLAGGGDRDYNDAIVRVNFL